MIETFKRFWAAGIAYLALLLGAGLSVAGNVADTFRTRGPLTDSLDIIMAAAWPILVLVTIELFVSRLWSTERGYQALRWTGCLAIGTMAMLVSWVHLHDLLATRGQLTAVAIVGPLAIDGMAIMATGLILSTRTTVAAVDVALTFQYARPIGPMPAALPVPAPTVADEGIPSYWGVADEASTWLDSLARSVEDSSTTPAAPVSGPPALARSNEVKLESIPPAAQVLLSTWEQAGEDRPILIDAYALIATDQGRSIRTVRRWHDAMRKA